MGLIEAKVILKNLLPEHPKIAKTAIKKPWGLFEAQKWRHKNLLSFLEYVMSGVWWVLYECSSMYTGWNNYIQNLW